MKVKQAIKLLRATHILKNLLIFIPLVFHKSLFDTVLLFKVSIGFLSFSFIACAVYVVNDIADAENDKLHNTKKFRPIACGNISIKCAFFITVIFSIISFLVCYFALDKNSMYILFIYFSINLFYSFKLKNIPLFDLAILSCGFVLRIIFGGIVAEIPISNWLFFVTMFASLFMSIGKRRNEIISECKHIGQTRATLKHYTYSFLDHSLYVCVSLTITFYAIWASQISVTFVWTTFLVLFIILRYLMNIENKMQGDPVEVLLKDKILMTLTVIYIFLTFYILYFA
jgi:4-hydroxybenzoate polyprenyltransferase